MATVVTSTFSWTLTPCKAAVELPLENCGVTEQEGTKWLYRLTDYIMDVIVSEAKVLEASNKA